MATKNVTAQALEWIAKYRDEVSVPLEDTSGRIAKIWKQITGRFKEGAVAINESDRAIIDSLESTHATITSFNRSMGRSSSKLFEGFGTDLRLLEKDIAILYTLGGTGSEAFEKLSATFVEAQGGVTNFSDRLKVLGQTAPKAFVKVVDALGSMFGEDMSSKLQDTLTLAIAGAGTEAFKELGKKAGIELPEAIEKAFAQGSAVVRRNMVALMFGAMPTGLALKIKPEIMGLGSESKVAKDLVGAVQETGKALGPRMDSFSKSLFNLGRSFGLHTETLSMVLPELTGRFPSSSKKAAKDMANAATEQSGFLGGLLSFAKRSFFKLLELVGLFKIVSYIINAIWTIIRPFVEVLQIVIDQFAVEMQDVLFNWINKIGPKIDAFLKAVPDEGLWKPLIKLFTSDKGLGFSTLGSSDRKLDLRGFDKTPADRYRRFIAQGLTPRDKQRTDEETAAQWDPRRGPITFYVTPEMKKALQAEENAKTLSPEGVVPPGETTEGRQISLLEAILSGQADYYRLIRDESNLFRSSEAEFTPIQISLSQFGGLA